MAALLSPQNRKRESADPARRFLGCILHASLQTGAGCETRLLCADVFSVTGPSPSRQRGACSRCTQREAWLDFWRPATNCWNSRSAGSASASTLNCVRDKSSKAKEPAPQSCEARATHSSALPQRKARRWLAVCRRSSRGSRSPRVAEAVLSLAASSETGPQGFVRSRSLARSATDSAAEGLGAFCAESLCLFATLVQSSVFCSALVQVLRVGRGWAEALEALAVDLREFFEERLRKAIQ